MLLCSYFYWKKLFVLVYNTFVSTFNVIPVEYGCQIYQKYIPLYEHYKAKNNKNLVQMSCTAYIVYTFHPSLHHANFGQFKAKQVLCGEMRRIVKVQWKMVSNVTLLPTMPFRFVYRTADISARSRNWDCVDIYISCSVRTK